MIDCIIYILVLKTVLPYPSSFQGEALNMPNPLQETRIRKYGLWKTDKMYGGTVHNKMHEAVLSNMRNGMAECI